MLDPISIVRNFQDEEDMPADGVAQVLLKEGRHAPTGPNPLSLKLDYVLCGAVKAGWSNVESSAE